MPGSVIRIFLVDGKADGLRTIELSNSTVYGTIFPRPSLEMFLKRSSSQRPGIYVLIGRDDETGSPVVYVGEGDPVGPRLKSHGTGKDFWTEAAVFTSKDDYVTKTQIQYLESRLIEAVKLASRATLDNANTPTLPNISEADEAEVTDFFATVRLLVGSSGFDFLLPWEVVVPPTSASEAFEFQIGSAQARLVRSNSSYVVLAVSTARATSTASAAPWIAKLRNQLYDAGNLAPVPEGLLTFTKDTGFASPSAAAAVVSGSNKNGLVAWKRKDGKTLKDVETA